jgi:hypothetical protein
MERAYEEGDEGAENQKWLQDLYAVMEGYGGVQQQAIPTYSNNEIYNQIDYQQQQPQLSVPSNPMSQHTTPVHAPLSASQQPSYDEDQNDQTQVSYGQDYSQYQQDSMNFSYQPNMSNMSMRRESQPQVQEQQQNYVQQNYEQNYQQQDYSYTGYDQVSKRFIIQI